jgi:FkbM family methyltransferase
MESEEPVHRHLAELFQRTVPDCVLDVGANEGQYGRMLREHGYEAWIVSFEPGRAAFARLAAEAECDPRWRVVPVALGARDERRPLAVTNVTQLSSFRKLSGYGAAEFPGASEVVGEEEVEIRTLNGSWEQLRADVPSTRPFLKLDTQGWDLEVLQGADRVLSHLVGIQLEASLVPIYEQTPTLPETVERVTALGFGLTGIFPVNRDSRFRLIEVDCVFVNPELIEPEDTWAMLEERLRLEIATVLPAESEFILIDEGTLELGEADEPRARVFLDYGRPESGEQAVGQLEAAGVNYVVLAWPSFWWLEEYPELADHLRTGWRRVSDTEAAIVFERQRNMREEN